MPLWKPGMTIFDLVRQTRDLPQEDESRISPPVGWRPGATPSFNKQQLMRTAGGMPSYQPAPPQAGRPSAPMQPGFQNLMQSAVSGQMAPILRGRGAMQQEPPPTVMDLQKYIMPLAAGLKPGYRGRYVPAAWEHMKQYGELLGPEEFPESLGMSVDDRKRIQEAREAEAQAKANLNNPSWVGWTAPWQKQLRALMLQGIPFLDAVKQLGADVPDYLYGPSLTSPGRPSAPMRPEFQNLMQSAVSGQMAPMLRGRGAMQPPPDSDYAEWESQAAPWEKQLRSLMSQGVPYSDAAKQVEGMPAHLRGGEDWRDQATYFSRPDSVRADSFYGGRKDPATGEIYWSAGPMLQPEDFLSEIEPRMMEFVQLVQTPDGLWWMEPKEPSGKPEPYGKQPVRNTKIIQAIPLYAIQPALPPNVPTPGREDLASPMIEPHPIGPGGIRPPSGPYQRPMQPNIPPAMPPGGMYQRPPMPPGGAYQRPPMPPSIPAGPYQRPAQPNIPPTMPGYGLPLQLQQALIGRRLPQSEQTLSPDLLYALMGQRPPNLPPILKR